MVSNSTSRSILRSLAERTVRLPVGFLALSAAVPNLQALRTLPQIRSRPIRIASLVNATSLARHSRQLNRAFNPLPAETLVLDSLFCTVGLEERLEHLGIELCVLQVCGPLIWQRSFDGGQTILRNSSTDSMMFFVMVMAGFWILRLSTI